MTTFYHTLDIVTSKEPAVLGTPNKLDIVKYILPNEMHPTLLKTLSDFIPNLPVHVSLFL